MPHGLGTQKGGVVQNCATWQAKPRGKISELFQKGPNRKNRAKAKMLIQLDLDLVHVPEFELVLDN